MIANLDGKKIGGWSMYYTETCKMEKLIVDILERKLWKQFKQLNRDRSRKSRTVRPTKEEG